MSERTGQGVSEYDSESDGGELNVDSEGEEESGQSVAPVEIRRNKEVNCLFRNSRTKSGRRVRRTERAMDIRYSSLTLGRACLAQLVRALPSDHKFPSSIPSSAKI